MVFLLNLQSFLTGFTEGLAGSLLIFLLLHWINKRRKAGKANNT